MSKLEALIQRLCPEGVEYKYLNDISIKISSGGTPKSGNSAYYNGTIPWLRTQEVDFNEISETEIKITDEGLKNSTAKWIPANCVIVAMYGATVGRVAINRIPLTTNQACCNIEVDPQCALYKYVFYCLWNQYEFIKSLGQGSQTNINSRIIRKLRIPIPPLEVQCEIVRILDRFTELSTELSKELTAELAAREKQFQFYRKQFFEFKKSDCVQIVCIKDICELLTGYPFDSSQFAATGINLLRGMNIKRGILDYSESNNRYWNSVQGYEKFLLSIDDIVIAMDGSLVGKSYAQVKSNHLPSLLVQRVARVRVTKANAHYVYHYISSGTFTRYVEKKKTGGAVPHITLKDIANFKIPLPSENMQKEISDSLDRFNALCNDLTSGLPAEIAARQKQYEYYRDKLLTFNSKEIL